MGSVYGFWRQLTKDQKQAKLRYIEIIYSLLFRKLVSVQRRLHLQHIMRSSISVVLSSSLNHVTGEEHSSPYRRILASSNYRNHATTAELGAPIQETSCGSFRAKTKAYYLALVLNLQDNYLFFEFSISRNYALLQFSTPSKNT